MVTLAVSTFRQLLPNRVPPPLSPEPTVAPEPVKDDDNAALPMAPRQPGEDVLFGQGTRATSVALFTVKAARRLLQERAHTALVASQRGKDLRSIPNIRKAPILSNVGLTDYSRDVTSHAIRRTFSDLFKGKKLYRNGTKSLVFYLLKQRAQIDLAVKAPCH
ncbi:hypothetical protein DFQ26_008910 [Actinomortierella ambigua]|nr:hypothetical protein DFQ26_008910 [Actinomortierella ambigua]